MKTRLIIAWIGNLIDMVATLHLSGLGFREVNPIMRPLLAYPWLFALVKLSGMTAVLLFLWIRRDDRHALPLATYAAVVNGLVATYYFVIFVTQYLYH